MVDVRTRLAAEIIGMIEQAYGGNIHIYKEYIPYSVRAAASSARGISIFAYDPRGKAAAAYEALAKTVISQEGSAGHE
jgi:chromosome partitioning protein